MSADAKAQSLEKVEASPGSKRKVLSELGVSKSDCYRWRARQKQRSLENRQHPGPSGNPLSPSEESMVLEVALDQTDLSSRQLAAWITDNKGFSVAESSVYRLLKRQKLVKSPEMKMAAGKEFHTKTIRPHQMWDTNASYFRVSGWGFYYLVTVVDDFSRFILASPFHPQTNGKLERYNRTIKLDVNQTPYDVPGNLEGAITDFVNYYNNRRYHKALGNVTPSDVLDCRREQNLQKRKDVRPRLFSADDYTINNSESSHDQHAFSISIAPHQC